MECGLTNLASCIPEKFIEYITTIINAPLQPLLDLAKNLLTEAVNVNLFYSLWSLIIYVISIFYGLFFMFAGFNFIISGYDSAKRENAKQWLANTIFMVIFVQLSFVIYSLINELSSMMTAGVINLINQNFFLLTVDNISNIGLELSLALPYVLMLLISVILLALRYLAVVVGVMFFPVGIFLYFIIPLRSYGRLIIEVLLIIMFLPFVHSIILLSSSLLIGISIFSNVKIVIMITAFLAVNLITLFLILFGALKAIFSVINSDVGRGAVKIAKYLV